MKKIVAMIVAELRRLTATRMAVLALAAMAVVPLLYGGLYLWANQNPDGALEKVPAAIVVADTGVTGNGEHSNLGQKVADQLVDGKSFDWSIASAKSAAAGVQSGRYDFSITFPADFSKALNSASGESPERARVTLTTNDTNSYLVSTIAAQAATSIKASVTATVNKQAASELLLGLSNIRSQLGDAVSGAAQLQDGVGTAQAGAGQLATGTAQLQSGSAALSDGLDTLRSSTSSLSAQTAALAAGAQQVASGNAQLATEADKAGALSQKAADAVPTVRQDIIDTLQAQGVPQSTIDDVLAKLDPLGADVATGNQQVQSAVGQVNQLSDGAGQVASGAQQLADASPALVSGIGSAADGAQQLADGSAQAATGAAALQSGLGTLQGGVTTLHDGLAKGVAQIPDSSASLRAQQAATIAHPVDLDKHAITSAGTYGAGLAPFFTALAAWIGIYALFLIVKPFSRRAITALRSPVKITIAGWLTPGLLGAAQMVGLFAVVTLALHFSVAHPVGMYGMLALASISYAAIIMALNVWLGSVGQFIGLILMVAQLVTAGGTFPWQTLPGPLAALHQVLPMSYAVSGIRELMYGGSLSAAWGDAGVLALWGVIALLVSGIGIARMTRFRTLRDLQPSLIG